MITLILMTIGAFLLVGSPLLYFIGASTISRREKVCRFEDEFLISLVGLLAVVMIIACILYSLNDTISSGWIVAIYIIYPVYFVVATTIAEIKLFNRFPMAGVTSAIAGLMFGIMWVVAMLGLSIPARVFQTLWLVFSFISYIFSVRNVYSSYNLDETKYAIEVNTLQRIAFSIMVLPGYCFIGGKMSGAVRKSKMRLQESARIKTTPQPKKHSKLEDGGL